MLRHVENKNQTRDITVPSTFLRGQLEFVRRTLATLWSFVRSMKSLFLLVFRVCVVLFALIGLGETYKCHDPWLPGCCFPRYCVLHKQWTTLRSCSKTCGWGQLVQIRKIKRYPNSCGGPCPHYYSPQRYKIISCFTRCCPVNCAWTWNSWSPCRGCGMSQQTRTMSITQSKKCGGTPCPTARSETRRCNTGM